jgi:thiamine pyrophosphokinase
MAARKSAVSLVLAGGDLGEVPLGLVPDGALVVAADSGLRHAATLDLDVDLVVGDLDSVDPVALDAAVARGVAVERHPCEKDEGDLELALRAAARHGATRIVVLGLAGGPRLDHFLSNALLLASDDFAHVGIEAVVGGARIVVVRDRVELVGRLGSFVTLLALGGPARGVRTAGLRYELSGDVLVPGSTRGLSNEITTSPAVVTLESGVLLAVQPADGTP